jgi:2-phosphosulfolactate phosphatase
MFSSLEVLLSPAEFALLPSRDLSQTACVVLDVLRATTSMVTALANGACEVIPVEDIESALKIRQQRPDVLLAGERSGFRIGADLTGGIEFDLGNSPREFVAAKVQNRSIVMTTTNGTRALKACAGARHVAVGALHNVQAVVRYVRLVKAPHLLIVCGGTYEQAALEDAIAAGALVDRLAPECDRDGTSDSAWMARQLYREIASDLNRGISQSRNGRRLLSIPELKDDVAFAAQMDVVSVVGIMQADAVVSLVEPPSGQH